MDYLTIKETSEKWGIGRMVTYYCVAGRIKDVIRKGNLWLILKNADKPTDGRTKTGKADVANYDRTKK